MNSQELVNAIRQFCQANENKENALKIGRYFKEAPEAYGLTQPQMNQEAKQLLKEKSFTLATLLEAIPSLLRGKYEEVTLAILLVNGFEKQYSRSLFDEMGQWFSFSIYNWAHADGMAMFVLPKFFKNKIVTEQDFKSWLSSPHKFQRRCVPVTLIKTLKTRDDFKLLFDFLEPLMEDPEREVHQGMGWFLRESWKLKPAETEEFLMQWKDKAPRLIFQYATEKMAPEGKLRFRRSK